jgi:glycosyltransferase involved in cell wall biosynthesis
MSNEPHSSIPLPPTIEISPALPTLSLQSYQPPPQEYLAIKGPSTILSWRKTNQGNSIYLDPTSCLYWNPRVLPSGGLFRWSSPEQVNAALGELFHSRKTKFDYQVEPWSLRAATFPNHSSSIPTHSSSIPTHSSSIPYSITYSIIMPIFNQANHIEKTLHALLNCIMETESCELIFLADGCTDLTEFVVSQWMTRYASHIPSLLIHIGQSIFETACDNLGAALSSGSFLLEIQADIVLHEKGFMSQLVKPIICYQDIIAVSGRCCHDALSEDAIGFLQLPSASSSSFNPVETSNNICYLMSTVNRGPLLIDRTKWNVLGGLDEVHFVLGEDDHEFLHRAYKQYGYRSAYIPIDFTCTPEHGSTRQPRSCVQQEILNIRRKKGVEFSPFPCSPIFALPVFRYLPVSGDDKMEFPLVSSIEVPMLPNPLYISLVSFANTQSLFFQNAELAFEAHVLHRILFSSTFLYNEFDIQALVGLLPLDAKSIRGWYYWSWKPWIVLQTMKKVPEDSILVYADVGLFFNQCASFYHLVQEANLYGSVFFSTNHFIYPYCKCEAWKVFQETKTQLDAVCMADAACFMIKNNDQNRSLLQTWLDVCCEPFYLSDIRTGSCSNVDNFQDHRHDQSLLTAVLRNHSISYSHTLTNIAWHHKSRSTEQIQHLRKELYESFS